MPRADDAHGGWEDLPPCWEDYRAARDRWLARRGRAGEARPATPARRAAERADGEDAPPRRPTG